VKERTAGTRLGGGRCISAVLDIEPYVALEHREIRVAQAAPGEGEHDIGRDGDRHATRYEVGGHG
jgi:hypothetical protein